MKIGFIGTGNMGYALLQAAMNGEDNDIIVYDKDEKKDQFYLVMPVKITD